MGFGSIKELADAYEEGRVHTCTFRKLPTSASGAVWNDWSPIPGTPTTNYYAAAPLEASLLDGDKGIFHGDDKSPGTKHLMKLGLASLLTQVVGTYVLCDYLLYYSFVSAETADLQTMDNAAASLTRYTDGVGVKVMAVALSATITSGSFTFSYTNQAGVSKTSPVQQQGAFVENLSTILCSRINNPGSPYPANPFLTLADGDTGVRSIQSLQFTSLPGGIFALVLVKPLATIALRETRTVAEVSFVQHRTAAPRIYDGAYLNLISSTPGSISGQALSGYAQFAWST